MQVAEVGLPPGVGVVVAAASEVGVAVVGSEEEGVVVGGALEEEAEGEGSEVDTERNHFCTNTIILCCPITFFV